MTTPSLHVCPWAAWAVVANPGANGNCFRVTRSTGRLRPLSKYHGFFLRRYGEHVVFIDPVDAPGGFGIEANQDARRQLVPNLCLFLLCWWLGHPSEKYERQLG